MPKFGWKFGHFTIYNLIEIETVLTYYEYGGSLRLKTQVQRSILFAWMCQIDNFSPKFQPEEVIWLKVSYVNMVWLNLLNIPKWRSSEKFLSLVSIFELEKAP